MAINALSLPTDIPWTRRCVTGDMQDPVICDERFPLKWRTSMAVFTYEPPETEQTLPDRIVSYVKVSCTITGHQHNVREVNLAGVSGFTSQDVTEAFDTLVGRYHACYGALLQVSVGGRRREAALQPLTDGPYIADFEPKKRELYELVTETGELMSRTLEGINVRKSNVTSQSTEVVDRMGVSFEASEESGSTKQAQQPEQRRAVQFSASNDETNVSGHHIEDTRTSDQSREARETFSHTTQLTQMYHQLTGYHVGTNRALFFILPRPHIVQAPQTFVKGPRHLEGVQEFFFVVVRPRSWEDFCIEAYLETAHISEPEEEEVLESRIWHTKRVNAGPETAPERDDSYDGPEIIDYDTFPLPPGMRIESWGEVSRDTHRGTVKVIVDTDTNLTVQLGAQARFIADNTVGELFGDERTDPGHAQAVFEVTLNTGKKRPKEDSRRMYLTARPLCCCDEQPFVRYKDVHIAYEGKVRVPEVGPRIPAPRGPKLAGGMSILQANAFGRVIGDSLMASVNAASRLPADLIGFEESEYVAGTLLEHLRPADDIPGHRLPGLEPALREKLSRYEGLRRSDLLAMSPMEQIDRFGLEKDELLNLRRGAIGRVESEEDRASVWDRRRFGGSTIPDVVHLDLADAKVRLQQAGVPLGNVVHVDSPACTGKVLKQTPAAGPRSFGQPPVSLEVATGASVVIPRLEGARLTDALIRLRDAGLRSQPRLEPERTSANATVRESRPPAGTWVTPNAGVTLVLREDR